MALGVRRDLSLVFFWTLFIVRIFQTESLTIWPVDVCPGNKFEVEAATLRLNCSDVKESLNVYHCLPLSNLSGLVEFCYDDLSGLTEKGNCLVLDHVHIDNRQCTQFITGCPTTAYYYKNIFNYPACLEINPQNSCYIADPSCPHIRFFETTSSFSVTAMENKTLIQDATTATDNKSLPVGTDANGNDDILIKYFPIALGILIPPITITIALVIFWILRRYKPNRKDTSEELELLNREPPSLKTDLKTNIPEHSMILVCEVNGSQRLPQVTEIFWTKDNVKIDIPINGGKYMGGTIADPSLQINEVDQSDAGIYQCTAINDAGTTNSVIINLELPIVKVQGASSGEGKVTISYSVIKEGSPKVHSIKWTKDGLPLDRNTQKYSDGGLEATYLKIDSPTEDDLGEYSCKISSILGSVADTLSLIVPVVTIPKQLIVTIGSPAIIEAKIKSCPSLEKIIWQKSVDASPDSFEDINIYASKYYGSKEDSEDPKLVLSSTTFDDRQYYRLLLFNGIVHQTSKMTLLKVEGDPPSLRTYKETNIAEHSVKLVCEVTVSQRSPTLTDFYWKKDNIKIEIHNSRGKYNGGSIADFSLEIKEVEQSDVGAYHCCATNAAGTMYSEIITLGPPTIFLTKQEDEENNGVIYEAKIESFPAALKAEWKVKWSANDDFQPIDVYDPTYKGSIVSLPNPRLIVNKNKTNQMGSFRIEVQNFIGTAIQHTNDALRSFYLKKGSSIRFSKLSMSIVEAFSDKVEKLKDILLNLGDIKADLVRAVKTSTECVQLLKEEDLFNMRDVIYMQYLLKETECNEAFDKCIEYAKREDALCFYEIPPVNGYIRTEFHVCGNLRDYNEEQIESIIQTVADIVNCKPDQIICDEIQLAGFRHSHSFRLLLSIKEKYIKILLELNQHQKERLWNLKVDYYIVGDKKICTESPRSVPMPAIDNSQREKEMDTLFCEDWHKSIGHVVCSDGTAATAFRVGSRYLMAPFHLIKKTFEMYVNKIIEHVLSDPHRSINYSRLLHKLQVGEFGRDIEKKLQNGIYEWLERTKYQILITSLLSALEESGFSCAKDRAVKFIEENLVYVYFGRTREHVDYKPYGLRYDIPFYSKVKEDDIALLEVDWTDLPKPFILEISRKRPEYVTIIGHPVSHGNVQIIDRRCPLIWECDAFQIHCKALSWWKRNYPNFDREKVKNDYDCMFRRKKVLFHCSKNATHGTSGGPGIIDLDKGSPKVYLMLQEGIPGFVYDTSMKEILMTCPKECLVESGTSMSRVYELLSNIPQLKELRDNIFHT